VRPSALNAQHHACSQGSKRDRKGQSPSTDDLNAVYRETISNHATFNISKGGDL
jgi:hypothetical protein